LGPNNRLTMRNRDRELTFPHGGENYLLASPGKRNASLPPGPPVFVGYGIHDPEHGWDDYANLTVRNRFVILMDGLPAGETRSGKSLSAETRGQYAGPADGPRKKLDTVSAMGAAGVIVVPGKRALAGWDGLSRHQRQFDFSAAEPYSGEQPPDSPLPVLVAHPRLLERMFKGHDYDPVGRKGDYRTFVLDDIEVELELDVAREPSTTHNVVAMVRGFDPVLREEYVVLSAHLDHLGTDGGTMFPGANDDASGCAALLEVAGAVAASPHERSVIFALFSAEEAGRLGSLHFLAHLPVKKDRIVSNVNLEQVGRKNPELEGFWVVGSDSLRPPLDSAVRRAVGSRVQFEPAESRMPVFRASDNFSFYARGIPSLLVSGGGFPEYHSAGDTPERIDFEYLRQASLFAYVVVMELASPRWPAPARLPHSPEDGVSSATVPPVRISQR
jgi:Peptidase family M28